MCVLEAYGLYTEDEMFTVGKPINSLPSDNYFYLW